MGKLVGEHSVTVSRRTFCKDEERLKLRVQRIHA